MAIPLAAVLRPKSIDDILGQEHLIGPGKALTQMIKSGKIVSFIIWGQAGTGKTTIAKTLAYDAAYDFKPLNATEAKIADIRKVIEIAESKAKLGGKTIVFGDEVHRWAKNVQDVLLPSVEDGTIILIGATTEKPVFSVNSALLSRMLIFEVKPLDNKAMMKIMLKVFKHYSTTKKVTIGPATAVAFINKCSGDARKLINVLETIIEVLLGDGSEILPEHVEVAMPDKHMWMDPAGNEHFDMASAFQNSIQNSDADQAVYFLGKWLMSGEDPAFIARRILVSAAEDAPLSSQAQVCALNALFAAERVGYPECRINMALAAIAIAKAPRNKIADRAIGQAIRDIETGVNVMVPVEMRAGSHDGYKKIINKTYVSGWSNERCFEQF